MHIELRNALEKEDLVVARRKEDLYFYYKSVINEYFNLKPYRFIEKEDSTIKKVSVIESKDMFNGTDLYLDSPFVDVKYTINASLDENGNNIALNKLEKEDNLKGLTTSINVSNKTISYVKKGSKNSKFFSKFYYEFNIYKLVDGSITIAIIDNKKYYRMNLMPINDTYIENNISGNNKGSVRDAVLELIEDNALLKYLIKDNFSGILEYLEEAKVKKLK